MEAVDPPDGGWGWMIVLGVLIQGFFTWGLMACYPLFYQPLMREFNIGLGQVTWINGAYEIGKALGYLFVPQATSRFGFRTTSMLVSATAGLTTSLAYFTSSDILVYILVGFSPGFVNGCLTIISSVIITRYFKKRRVMALSLTQIGSPLGTLLLAPLLQILIEQYGMRGAILIAGGLSFNCVVSSALFRPIRLHTDNEENVKSSNISSCSILALCKTWVVIFITVASFGGFRLYLSYLVPLALDRLDTDPVIASLLLSISSAASIGMRGLLGAFGDHKRVNMMWIICFSMILTAFVCGIVWFANTYAWLVVNCVLFSVTTVTVHIMNVPLTIAAVGEENLQKGMSWIGFIFTLLMSVVLPTTGLLIDAFIDVRIGFATAAILFLISSLLFIPLLHKRKEPDTNKRNAG